MGRKIDLKKIENSSKCHVTFTKRRNSLIKKSYEISVYCGVDVLFLTFSPSGRVTHYCSRQRMEDVLQRYINMPSDKKHQGSFRSFSNLTTLGVTTISCTTSNLELQIKKANVELEITEANLKEYEPEKENKSSMTQLMWCEKNLKNTLNRITNRKQDLLLAKLSSSNGHFSIVGNLEKRQVEAPLFSNNSSGNNTDQLMMNVDEQNLISNSSGNSIDQLMMNLYDQNLISNSSTGNNIDQLMMDLDDDLLMNIQDDSFINNSSPLRRQVAELEGDDINGIGNQNGVVPPQAFTSTEQHPLSSSSPALQSLQPSNGFFNVPSDNQVPVGVVIDETPYTIDQQFQTEASEFNWEMREIGDKEVWGFGGNNVEDNQQCHDNMFD
ncbi:agamous-like MADS-box protein AGL66 [Carica papaya]|uniref:agamous-like MADS-box protein AGL66 n=1 Tax=Carica papaya TaxID=3649 RepID=UPI000B8C8ABB|nr:agamous-like MADS-box protein AGL66 [Carica papaya]